MKILIVESFENEELMKKIYKTLIDIRRKEDRIEKVRYSPNKKKVILDMKFNKVLEVFIRDDKIVVKGDSNYGEYIQGILRKKLQ